MYTWGTFSIRDILPFLQLLVLVTVLFLAVPVVLEGATITTYRDTLSDSAPNVHSNHTIEFITTVAIPPGGYIRFVPSPGDFEIPASADFDIDNVELLISTSSSTYYPRSAASSPSATEDGISITTGASGQIEITLNATEGIPANAGIQIKIGDHTSNATTTDISVRNPTTTGSFPIFFETGGSGLEDESVRGWIAIVDRVEVPNIDTTETDPPVRFNGAPTGVLSGTVTNVEMSLETDEFAKCRYSTATGTPYFAMTNEFTTNFAVVHQDELLSLATNTTYTFFVRCIDDEGNFNTDDYIITFTIPEPPEGTPGDSGSNEGEGEGGGTGTGEDGTGGGSSGGDDDGDDSGSEGSSGGGGGGGGGSSGSEGNDGGGFEGTERPYQSGDARVIINGYAFPGSSIVVLVDGVQAEQGNAGGNGSFSVTIDEIARGVYTFGVYAIDRNGTRSSTFSTTFSVTGSRGSTLSNVNIMPTIVVDPDPVDPGSNVNFSGYSIPDATVTIENQSDRSSIGLKTFTATSDGNGRWSLDVSTDGFQTGTYKVRAKAKQDAGLGISTNFSEFTYYGVGEEAAAPRTSDLNRDGFVNLIDFSILLFWWNSDGGNSNPPADINADGTVSLTDFSIMIFNWTG